MHYRDKKLSVFVRFSCIAASMDIANRGILEKQKVSSCQLTLNKRMVDKRENTGLI
jgi:hypothetical protein